VADFNEQIFLTRGRIRKTVKGGPGFGMAALPDQGPTHEQPEDKNAAQVI